MTERRCWARSASIRAPTLGTPSADCGRLTQGVLHATSVQGLVGGQAGGKGGGDGQAIRLQGRILSPSESPRGPNSGLVVSSHLHLLAGTEPRKSHSLNQGLATSQQGLGWGLTATTQTHLLPAHSCPPPSQNLPSANQVLLEHRRLCAGPLAPLKH